MPADLLVLRPRLESILDRAIHARAFPGSVVRLEWQGQVLAVARGRLGYAAPFDGEVSERTIYDLASLTKAWTATAALLEIRARRLPLGVETPLRELLPDLGVPDKCAITLRHLMQHSSGISFAIQSLVPCGGAPTPREKWLGRIASEPLHSAPGERVLYSCTNFFLLARALEMDGLSGPLKALIEDGRFLHTDFASLSLHPAALATHLIAPTEVDGASGHALRGEVHDEAARFWSSGPRFSFAGNAGLFGDAESVGAFARMWLRDGLLHPDDLKRALCDTLPEGTEGTRRGWGWQIDSAILGGPSGVGAPRGAFGHAGFTGPTLWAHRATQSICLILNNRVHPTRHGPNRLPFHREISDCFARFLQEHDEANFNRAESGA